MMPRSQIVVHLRDNPGFSFDDLIELETFLGGQSGLASVEFDGHDFGENDSNIFLFSQEIENAVDLIVKYIKSRPRNLKFALGTRTDTNEAEYDVVACRGICDIIVQ